jgi:hypothetical protein
VIGDRAPSASITAAFIAMSSAGCFLRIEVVIAQGFVLANEWWARRDSLLPLHSGAQLRRQRTSRTADGRLDAEGKNRKWLRRSNFTIFSVK